MTDGPLTGQIAWVTGSSRGLGRVMAEHLGRLGADLVVHGTTQVSARAFGEGESLDQVAHDVAARTGRRVLAVPADLTRPDQVQSAVATIRAELGRIDILVNNAGGDIGPAGATGPGGGRPRNNDGVYIALEDLRAVIDRNLLSCIYVCREVAPEMIERRAGRIVNLGSVAGLNGRAEGVMYATAKAAVHEYTRCLAVQLRPYNVTVNCVAPGGTMTPRFVATGQARPGVVEKVGTLEGYGQPEDIAHAVAYFVTDAGRHVSGQILRVDGGDQTWPA
jgi:3-oxoacyl-[acyl-carrier protein] reductase